MSRTTDRILRLEELAGGDPRLLARLIREEKRHHEEQARTERLRRMIAELRDGGTK